MKQTRQGISLSLHKAGVFIQVQLNLLNNEQWKSEAFG